MEQIQSINGQNNEFIIILPQGRIDCLASGNGKLSEIVSRANISIIGNNNRVIMYFESEESARRYCLAEDFSLL